MRLTQNDKECLREWGYPECDLLQIEEATQKTIYTCNDKRLSARQAIELLGRETYLSGISRSAFHWSCVRETESDDRIYFDSSRLFK